jgi:hypothetical protein
MAKKELTKAEYNAKVWAEVKTLEDSIKELKGSLHPAELPRQASLNECNALARKAAVKPVTVIPKKVSAERGE